MPETPSYAEPAENARKPTQLEQKLRRTERALQESENRCKALLAERAAGFAPDITKQKKTEAELRESEQKYRTIFENAPLGIFRSTPAGKFIEVNQALADLLGYDRPETVVNDIHSIADQIYIRPAKRSSIVETQLQTSGMTRHLNHYRRRDGSEFIANLYLKTVRDDDGNPRYLEGIVEDVTARLEAEEKITEALAWHEAVFEGSRDAIFISDEHSKFISVNQAAAELTGYGKDELLSMRIPDLHEEMDLDAYNKYHDRIMAGEAIVSEAKVLRKDGQKVDTEFSNQRIVISGSLYMHTTARDISDRKRAENRIRLSEELFSKAFHSGPLLMTISDLASGTYLQVNENFLRVSGYRREEVIGKTSVELGWVSNEDRKRVADEIRKYGRIDGVELHLRKKTGERVTCWYFGEIITVSGEKRLLSIAQDITEKYETERQKQLLEKRLSQAQKMEAIGTLAGGIAHDFNNILSPIVGFTELLADDIPPDSRLKRYADEIYRAALRARDLVRQILTFSRQADREIMPVHLQPILKEALKLLRSTIPTTINIHHAIDPDCGVVLTDPTQFHQIVMNLATNAYHAMEETGGKLSVSLNEIRLDSDPSLVPESGPGEYALLKVTDTGIGMEKQVLEKIFDPYFTTKADGKGTGLGLSIVQGIVKSCHGDLHISSEPGKGTEVRIYLPILRRCEETFLPDVTEAVQGGEETILLVDDELPIIRLEEQLLERLGYRVVARTGSIEALAAFRADPRRFDLVITDMTMPNMTGDRLALELKKIRPDIPVIICTGFSSRIDAEKCRALGIQGLVTKPILKREIGEAIRNALENAGASIRKSGQGVPS